ncbi:unnamed protein product [Calypogeia fissa]
MAPVRCNLLDEGAEIRPTVRKWEWHLSYPNELAMAHVVPESSRLCLEVENTFVVHAQRDVIALVTGAVEIYEVFVDGSPSNNCQLWPAEFTVEFNAEFRRGGQPRLLPLEAVG